mmetsp:Transcript_29124/g.45645  ORF Transcript_29124/g.45645 Transcript_29124/m.45645 type:complete len:219 (+) Transcript_29124:265-921(+)|eukprot:CAMPEP_0184330036 /NCGR_PEP_ID=MMETSP1049-20130417/144464_1 /TAXON_ID=77928 /ORGANISM="Proteomonas sulcata, Strain CCMP704" /LENGTH=218 /DNA_ID=CAMNT_0026652441 /DNA_START=36 /DNA_END=692 /DNA_ORIENTATION=-
MAENVYLFIPNLIGYVRVLTGLIAFYQTDKWEIFFTFYFISYFLDCIDGLAARKFKQATRFGQMLDMVTDRCCTACLLGLLAHLYSHKPAIAFACYTLLSLDLASHYCHLYSQLLVGAASHKKLAETENWLLRLYYHNTAVLFTLCLFNETCFVMSYLLYFASDPTSSAAWTYTPAYFVFVVSAPFCLIKQYLNVLQFVSACGKIVAHDVAERSSGKK